MKNADSIVRVSGVIKDFNLSKTVVHVLKGIDLEIKTGEYISIMGPSGSGKTTLFNMIGGLDKPTSGSVFIDEIDISQLNAELKTTLSKIDQLRADIDEIVAEIEGN
jgi:putative ABC transport system ATP-binding protein